MHTTHQTRLGACGLSVVHQATKFSQENFDEAVNAAMGSFIEYFNETARRESGHPDDSYSH
eukprot:4576441-Pyramimonas_sp.AAC.1